MREGRRPRLIPSTMLLVFCVAAAIGCGGCGQTANPFTPASAGKVYSYFGGPFISTNPSLPISSSTFDHFAGNINVTSFLSQGTGQVPTVILSGTFVSAPTGFLSITENFSTSGGGTLIPLNPPVTGAWAVEIPGGGAIGNFLSLSKAGAGFSVSAAPVAVAENSACPNFQTATPFLYVTVPTASTMTSTADYGSVAISTSGSAVTFNAQPYLVGRPVMLSPSTVAGGCSETYFGPLTAYPLNSFGTASSVELINIGRSGFLLSSYTSTMSLGAFGNKTGAIGVAEPSGPVDVSAVIGAKYNGFIYAPQHVPTPGYDIRVLAAAYGDYASNAQACSMLQSSLAANQGHGVAALPSGNSLYGGEFLTTTSSGPVNNPTGANGPENCDSVIDLGTQDSTNNGLFPNATVFIGSNYPPFSATNPWNCFGTTSACAVSFPAVAVVGQVQGQYVIFVAASATSTPVAAQLPIASGATLAQPVGIYLIQKSP